MDKADIMRISLLQSNVNCCHLACTFQQSLQIGPNRYAVLLNIAEQTHWEGKHVSSVSPQRHVSTVRNQQWAH